MTISPFRYAGAKNRLLPILMPHIDKTIQQTNNVGFADCFLGGGSVLLAVAEKYPTLQLFGNDADPWVSNFWSIVSNVDCSKLDKLLTLLDTQPTIELFLKLSQTPPTTDIERAYYAIFFNRTCFSGIIKRDENDRIKSSPIGGKEQKSKWKVDCRFNGKKLKEKIKACHKLLVGRTIIENQDFTDFIPMANDDCLSPLSHDTPIYCDPPYIIKGDMLYNECMSMKDHEVLADILHTRSNWVLSYDDCPEVKKLYDGCEIIDLAARYSVQGKKSNWDKKNELIITR